MSESGSEREELVGLESDIDSAVGPSGLVGADPVDETEQTDPLAALERSAQFKARLFVMICTVCAVVSLVLLMLGLWPFDS